MLIRLLVATALVLMVSQPSVGAVPDGAMVLDPDVVWDVANPEAFSISPDGKLIAYISKGAVWSCPIAGGPPTKLADLPKSITSFLVLPGNEQVREQSAVMPLSLGYVPIRGLTRELVMVFSLAWTPSQDGVVYTTRTRLKDNSTLAAFHVMHVSLDATVNEIATLEREYVVYFDSGTNFRVSRNGRFVVVTNYGVPLIWDVQAKGPRATCFDFLIPSSSSGRWLGVEIDTRQLVLADEDFRVVQRFDVYFAQQRRCELVWSPDERYAACLTHLEHPSDKTEGFRIDLQTGTKTPLNAGVIRDQFYFTGKGGELVRLGIAGIPPNGFGDGSYGAYISVLADNADAERDVIRFRGPPPEPKNWRDRKSYPPILGRADGSLFAIALPRSSNRAAGFHYHLVDRTGKRWPFLPDEDATYNSPYYPLAFTNDGQTIIARDGATLFSVPVSSIKDGASDD